MESQDQFESNRQYGTAPSDELATSVGGALASTTFPEYHKVFSHRCLLGRFPRRHFKHFTSGYSAFSTSFSTSKHRSGYCAWSTSFNAVVKQPTPAMSRNKRCWSEQSQFVFKYCSSAIRAIYECYPNGNTHLKFRATIG